MTDAPRIARTVAIESEMAYESLSALTAVIQEGIDRTLAARAGLSPETIAELRRLLAGFSLPFEVYRKADIGDANGHVGSMENTEIAGVVVSLLNALPKLLDMVASPLSAVPA